jgi:hypothetical protein
VCGGLEGSLCPAVEVSGFNSPRIWKRCSVHGAAAVSASAKQPRQLAKLPTWGGALGLRSTGLRAAARLLRAAGAERTGRRRSQLGLDFLPPPKDNKTTDSRHPALGSSLSETCSHGLPAEQRQRQIGARLSHPTGPRAQRGARAAHHVLRVLRVPGGVAPTCPDPLWPRVSVWGAGIARPPPGECDAGEPRAWGVRVWTRSQRLRKLPTEVDLDRGARTPGNVPNEEVIQYLARTKQKSEGLQPRGAASSRSPGAALQRWRSRSASPPYPTVRCKAGGSPAIIPLTLG